MAEAAGGGERGTVHGADAAEVGVGDGGHLIDGGGPAWRVSDR